MAENSQNAAWIEGADGAKVPVEGACGIGRASGNQVVLNDEKVSRRHAAIHQQGPNEFWLVDLGSRNGVTLNTRRITQSTRLSDGDRFQIGPFHFVFRQPAAPRRALPEAATIDKTVSDIKPSDCWLMVLDIESSTHLSQKLSAEELPVLTGRWFEQCKQTVEREGGSIDKFLGDGFMAYWRSGPGTDQAVTRVLGELKRIRSEGPISFRTVLHFGRVFSGGATASGVERFFGPEINYVFKMEGLAKGLRLPNVVSRCALDKIEDRSGFKEAGEHEVAGFEGRFPFFTY